MLWRTTYSLILLSLSTLLTACFPLFVAGAATGVSVAHDRRSVGTIIDDQSIELKVKSRLAEEAFYRDAHIVVVSYNNYVLLTGQTLSEANAIQATQLASEIEGVRNVYNELEIGEPIGFARRSQDTWLTTRVKTKLLSTPNVDPTRIKVISENGRVFLMGIITPNEATLATEAVRNVGGVRAIVRLFNYIEEPEAPALEEMPLASTISPLPLEV